MLRAMLNTQQLVSVFSEGPYICFQVSFQPSIKSFLSVTFYCLVSGPSIFHRTAHFHRPLSFDTFLVFYRLSVLHFDLGLSTLPF